MGLFDSLKRRRELDALERAYQAHPSADSAIALADKQANSGQVDVAVTTSRDALRDFPKSEKLFARYVYLRRQQVGPRLRALKSELASDPTPPAYAELIDIYLDLDEIDRALELCRECTETFPDDEQGYRQAGRIRLWRWRTDRLARDGQRAIELLTLAADRDRGGHEALRLLAEFYLQLGAASPALRNLQAISRFLPDDDTIGELVVRAEALPGADDSSVDEQLESIERGGLLSMNDPRLLTGIGARVQPPSMALQGRPPDTERLSSGLDELARLPGFQCALLTDPTGQPAFARQVDPSRPQEVWLELTSALLDVARTATLRTDLGRFYRAQLEGPDGPLLLAECEGYGLAAFFGPAAPKPEVIWDVVEALIGDAWSGR